MKARTDSVIILWTANTEQFLLPEIQTIEEMHQRVRSSEALPSSVLYCIAAIEESVTYLNGSP